MFGSRPSTRRPLLLVLVFGAFLAIIGITATAQAALVWLHVSTPRSSSASPGSS